MKVNELLQDFIGKGAFPGASWAIGTETSREHGAVGNLTYENSSPLVEDSTVYDLASLTKVICTTTLAMELWQEGKLELDKPAAGYWPEFGANGKENVTIRNLLAHNSGLIAYRTYHEMDETPTDILASIGQEPLQSRPGAQTVYSDLGFMTLGHIIEMIENRSLEGLFEERIAGPLGMKTAGFRPHSFQKDEIAPTEQVTEWRKSLHNSRGIDPNTVTYLDASSDTYIWGEVHDETCLLLGGVSGHAGLFASSIDLEKFAKFLLYGAQPGQGKLPTLGTIHAFSRRLGMESSRALGWDTRSLEGYSSAGKLFGRHAFGHTGFTGTSIWVDPEAEKYCILLTNRVLPSRERTGLADARSSFADLAYRC